MSADGHEDGDGEPAAGDRAVRYRAERILWGAGDGDFHGSYAGSGAMVLGPLLSALLLLSGHHFRRSIANDLLHRERCLSCSIDGGECGGLYSVGGSGDDDPVPDLWGGGDRRRAGSVLRGAADEELCCPDAGSDRQLYVVFRRWDDIDVTDADAYL